jgi:GH24 family phage-related lysozyme (muramidase)
VYAYPDPLTPLAKKYKGLPWGFKPARELLALIKDMDESDGMPWTVGFGFTQGTTPDSVIQRTPAERKLESKILEMDATLGIKLPWYKDTSHVVKTVLINMAFNMGWPTLLTFKNTLRFVAAKNYTQAARNMTLSKWYGQVGDRAKELVARMATQTIEAANKAPERI